MKVLLDMTKVLAGEELKSKQLNKVTPPKKGIFSRMFTSSKKNQIITQKDTDKIENFFESIIK